MIKAKIKFQASPKSDARKIVAFALISLSSDGGNTFGDYGKPGYEIVIGGGKRPIPYNLREELVEKRIDEIIGLLNIVPWSWGGPMAGKECEFVEVDRTIHPSN